MSEDVAGTRDELLSIADGMISSLTVSESNLMNGLLRNRTARRINSPS